MAKKKKVESSTKLNSFVKTSNINFNERFISTTPPEIDSRKVQVQVAELKRQHQLFASVFNTSAGKKVIEELEKVAYFKNSTFNVNEGRMQYNEGQRMLLLHIKNLSNSTMFQTLRDQILEQGGSNV